MYNIKLSVLFNSKVTDETRFIPTSFLCGYIAGNFRMGKLTH